ncbi:hypothetical protein Acr_08g0014440 [Actinidia rufa]|uniref:F-box protein At3g26010-like beta-propeller domain-containing protein n=1 Tax=Actinidia rufa TaxID=165716 RepID=A0A7J0F2X9_9ERIC|nr:hypothetical protein Acr_08g0014440 [Actinidia rufa]
MTIPVVPRKGSLVSVRVRDEGKKTNPLGIGAGTGTPTSGPALPCPIAIPIWMVNTNVTLMWRMRDSLAGSWLHFLACLACAGACAIEAPPLACAGACSAWAYMTAHVDQFWALVRAGVSNPRKRSTELEVETFSFDTGEWKVSTILCTSTFTLAVANRPVDKIIYWKYLRSLLVAYNPTKKCVDLIELPLDAQNVVCWGDLFGLSKGVIQYARHNNCYLEVWVLKNAQWERTHKLSFARMFRQHGRNEYKGLSMKAFHPFDSRRIMFTWHGRPLWFDLESRKVDIVSHHPICNQLLSL